jgi:hypothetical protein
MKYASFLVISRALHLNVFDQPVKNHFFNNLLAVFKTAGMPLRPYPSGGNGKEHAHVSAFPFALRHTSSRHHTVALCHHQCGDF